jgi:hypothetical protein
LVLVARKKGRKRERGIMVQNQVKKLPTPPPHDNENTPRRRFSPTGLPNHELSSRKVHKLYR